MSADRPRPPAASAPDTCIGCAACVTTCPVAASDGRFAGPKALGPALRRRAPGGWPGETGFGPDAAAALGADLCLQCHQCDLACPSGLAVSTFTRQAKELALQRPEGRFASFASNLVADQERFGRLVGIATGARRTARILSPRLAVAAERVGLGLLGLSRSRSLPAPPRASFAAWLQATRRPEVEHGRPPALLFAGCHIRFHDPAVGRAATTVLRAVGYQVILPGQVCCGSPALGSGREELGARAVAANLRLLTHASERLGGGVPIVSPCPSCTLALRRGLPEFAPGQASDDLARQVWDLGEFLDGPARGALHRAFSERGARKGSRGEPPVTRPWVYHMPCHLRALGTGRVFPWLVEEAGFGPPADPGPAADGCCGMGGLSGLTRDGHGRSLITGSPVLEAYRALSGPSAPTVLSDCPACRWQAGDATGLATAHPVEWLARAFA